MQNIRFQELHTPRLELRALTMEDLPLYYERLGSSEAVTRYMLWKPHTSLDESAASIQKALRRYETGDSCRWAITLKTNGELIGIIDLIPVERSAGTCSFAYMLCEEFWGMGYGTEALQAVVDYAFQFCGAESVQADHFAENPASGAVMRKVGMTFLGTISGKYEKNGVAYDAPQYRITKEEWLSRQLA